MKLRQDPPPPIMHTMGTPPGSCTIVAGGKEKKLKTNFFKLTYMFNE